MSMITNGHLIKKRDNKQNFKYWGWGV